MHCPIHRCRRAVFVVVAIVVIGSLLLSACGRVADGAVPDTAIPSALPTAPTPGTVAQVPAAPFTLDGAIEQLAQERWVVAGTTVVLDAQTAITGTPARGALSHIQGAFTADGALLARTITIETLAATSTVAPTPPAAPPNTPSPMPPPPATPIPPTATLAPTATAAPTTAPGVMVPDISGQNVRDAQKTLAAAGLRLGDSRERCEDIGASDSGRKLKKGQIRCQSPAPGSTAVRNTSVLIVLVGGQDNQGD